MNCNDGMDNPARTVATAKAAEGGEFRRRYLARLWGSPLVLAPLVLGASAFMGNWALNLHSGLLAFGGVAGVLGAAGIFLTRALLGGESIGREVAQELASEAEKAYEMRLYEIQRGLLADNDPDNDHFLKDLKEIVTAFRNPATWPDSLDSATRATISGNVERIFDCSLRQMEKAQQLWSTARELQSASVREPILRKRKEILNEVGRSLRQLSEALAGLSALGATASSATSDAEAGEIRRLQSELEQNLQVARAAEERMSALEREIGARDA